MAAAWTRYGKRALIGPCGGKATTFPATWYLALTSTEPGQTGVMTGELAGGGYARLAVANDDPTWTDPATAGAGVNREQITNTAAITFPESTGAQGSAVYVVGCDHPTAGNAWWYYPVPGGAFPIDRAGIAAVIASGTLQLGIEDP